MSKRFTATEKWDKAWYRKLSPRMKCLWQFLCDRCDQSGVLDMDWDLASFQIGEEVSFPDLNAFGERVQVLKGGTLWIPSFIEFQYGKLSDTCPAHKPVIRSLCKHFPSTNKIGYQYPIGNLQEEEEEKETEEEKEVEGEREGRKKVTPPVWNPSEDQAKVGSWFHRRPTTPWSEKEVKAFKSIPPEVFTEGVQLLHAAYSVPHGDNHRTRKDLITLLNNWQGEIDRWRNYKPALRSDVQAIETDNEELGFLTNDDAIFHKDRP